MTITANNLSAMSTEQKREFCRQEINEQTLQQLENLGMIVLNREYLSQETCDKIALLKDQEAINPKDLSPQDVDLLAIMLCEGDIYDRNTDSPKPTIEFVEKGTRLKLGFNKAENTQFIMDIDNCTLEDEIYTA